MSDWATAPRMPTSMVSSAANISSVVERAAGEQQRLGPDDRVHADLGEQAGEDRGHRRGRGRVAVGQPGRQREHRGLDPEREQQHRLQHQPRCPGQVRRSRTASWARLTRAGRGVDQPDRGQEDQRARAGSPRRRWCRPGSATLGAAEGEQHVAGGQQDLEADEEVEQVAGEERVGDAGGQHQERRVEDRQRGRLRAVGRLPARRRRRARRAPRWWRPPASARPAGRRPARCRAAPASRRRAPPSARAGRRAAAGRPRRRARR